LTLVYLLFFDFMRSENNNYTKFSENYQTMLSQPEL
jgi:hypothetical protein